MWDHCVQFCFYVCQQTRRLALVAAAVFHFQMFLTSFFCLYPAADSPEEKITSQKESKQGRQPWEGMTSNAAIFSSKPITPTPWRGWGPWKRPACSRCAAVDHFSRTILRQPWKTATYPVCSRPHSNTKYSFLTVLRKVFSSLKCMVSSSTTDLMSEELRWGRDKWMSWLVRSSPSLLINFWSYRCLPKYYLHSWFTACVIFMAFYQGAGKR